MFAVQDKTAQSKIVKTGVAETVLNSSRKKPRKKANLDGVNFMERARRGLNAVDSYK
jgi:hypothetical protein